MQPLRTKNGSVVLIQPRAMLMSVAHVTTEAHADVWSGLQPEVVLMPVDAGELALTFISYHMTLLS